MQPHLAQLPPVHRDRVDAADRGEIVGEGDHRVVALLTGQVQVALDLLVAQRAVPVLTSSSAVQIRPAAGHPDHPVRDGRCGRPA